MSYRSNNSANLKTIALIFLFGMVFGYLVNCWQQIAQRQHRDNCAACRMNYHGE